MLPLSYALALALITNPVEVKFSEELLPYNLSIVKQIAIEMEILDERESAYFLHDYGYTGYQGTFISDVNIIKHRYQDLKDCPPSHHHLMFRDKDLLADLMNSNRNYRLHLEGLLEIELANELEIRKAIEETDELYDYLSIQRDIVMPIYYVQVRRQALKKMKGILGDKDYYAGRFPPHIPIWRFRRVD